VEGKNAMQRRAAIYAFAAPLQWRLGRGIVEAMRLDQWLWAVRVFKSRTLAADVIKAGRASVNGQPCKPAHEVRAGELVVVRIDWERERTLRVLAAPPSRVGAKRVAEFAEEAGAQPAADPEDAG
jgi:ribosomal 50S subunit-recycling heat shock protein